MLLIILCATQKFFRLKPTRLFCSVLVIGFVDTKIHFKDEFRYFVLQQFKQVYLVCTSF